MRKQAKTRNLKFQIYICHQLTVPLQISIAHPRASISSKPPQLRKYHTEVPLWCGRLRIQWHTSKQRHGLGTTTCCGSSKKKKKNRSSKKLSFLLCSDFRFTGKCKEMYQEAQGTLQPVSSSVDSLYNYSTLSKPGN